MLKGHKRVMSKVTFQVIKHVQHDHIDLISSLSVMSNKVIDVGGRGVMSPVVTLSSVKEIRWPKLILVLITAELLLWLLCLQNCGIPTML